MARNNTRALTLSAMLVAIMLILGFIEQRIPLVPADPHIKLGLSNSVLLFAVYWLGIPTAFVLMLLKVLLSGFLFAGVNAMLYALAGGTLSVAFMSLFYKGIHCLPARAKAVRLLLSLAPMLIGAVGGAMHNVGQVSVAMLIFSNNPHVVKGLVRYMMILAAIGAGMGVFTGFVAKLLIARLPASMRPHPAKQKRPASKPDASAAENLPQDATSADASSRDAGAKP